MEEIFKTMKDLVAEQFAMEPSEITMDTSFEEDLGADSVDLVELVMAMEENADVDWVIWTACERSADKKYQKENAHADGADGR